MDTKKIIALVLLGLFAVVLIQNKGVLLDGVTVKMLFTSLRSSLSMVMLGTLALGVTVGILLK